MRRKLPLPRSWKRRVRSSVAGPVHPKGTLNAFSSVLGGGHSGPRSECPISLDHYTTPTRDEIQVTPLGE